MRSSAGLAEIETSRLRCPGALEDLPGRSEFAGLFGAPRRLRHRPALRATRFFRVCPPVSARCLPPQLGVDLVEVDLALGRADRGIGRVPEELEVGLVDLVDEVAGEVVEIRLDRV